jgi:hypothetical protein
MASDTEPKTIMLLGPGRWGTSTPSLGIPVSFSEISPVSVICEIVAMREDLVPDISLGTHFFSDLIENEMLYIGYYPTKEESILKKQYFEQSTNKLSKLLPDNAKWENVIHVIDPADSGQTLELYADTVNQKVICSISD